MAFIRYTTVEGKRYYHVVRSYREGGKPRQEVLAYLGRHDSLEGAIEYRRQEIDAQRNAISALREVVKRQTAHILRRHGVHVPHGDKIPSQAELKRRRQGIEHTWQERDAEIMDLLSSELVSEPHERYEEAWERLNRRWDGTKDLHYHSEILELIRQKNELVKEHQAKLDKYLEIKQSYGDLKYKGTGSNLDRL